MSPPPGRPKEGSLPPGGKARSAKGVHIDPPPGRPKEGSLPPGGKARSAKGAHIDPPPGRPKEGSLPPGGKARRAKGGHIDPPPGRPQEASLPLGGKARRAKGAHIGRYDAAIVVVGLKKSYGSVAAVNGVSFAVRAGTTTALLGGNGAGKTTTLSMLLGVLTPSAGRITVLGEDMQKHRHRVLPRMNFTSPYVDLPKRLSVAQNLRVFADLYGVRHARARIAAIAEECDLSALLKRPYGELSAGQRTRVSLAKAVLNEPEVMLLDEPTASLDPDIGDRMRTYLEQYQRRSGCTMLLASHHMGEVERMCDDVIMLRAGLVVDQGSPQELIARYGRESMEQVFLDVARGRDDPLPHVPARGGSSVESGP